MRSLTVFFADYCKVFDSVDKMALSRSSSGTTVFLIWLSWMWCSCIMVPPQQSRTALDIQKRSIPPVVFYKGIPCRQSSLSSWSTTFSYNHSSMKMDLRCSQLTVVDIRLSPWLLSRMPTMLPLPVNLPTVLKVLYAGYSFIQRR